MPLQPGSPAFYSAALVAAALLYFLILVIPAGLTVGRALASTIANIAPIVIGGLAVRASIRSWVARRRVAVQFGAHIAMAVLFTLFWFWLLMVLLGAINGDSAVLFSVEPFMGLAAAWQLMQGLTIYAVLALLFHYELLRETMTPREPATGETPPQFVRDGDELRPLDPERIVHIAAAGDYAEMHTPSGSHLLRTTLAELETSLGNGFLRIHRSRIVNTNRVARMEPAGGGRMTLHMDNGDSLTTSRAGAKAVRDRVL
ncbi:LytTR family transcriptional regulator [Parasphingopyxis algicola]|uniref:LytTR family DNA-binding domain-containing protein n=1 Tax=Parasphingopyxis algicola TaxID=2026624 RepID=UPI0015A0129F|nr:LytTR family DNA-binding domain-containing protein [Parasphingopyxis algicola]QLC25913.1 LytTR family transcriptional regulator [Parasphingopyxis algicola]